MRLSCDLEVQINSEQTFILSKEVLLPRCGRLLKEYRRALKVHRQRQEGGISSVKMLLHDMPGGGKAFELVARFCYKGGWMKLGPDSVALMRCAADYLEMSEEYGAGNLLQCTESFLSTIDMWSWKDVLVLLSSCESLLPHAENCGIIQLCVDSLAMKANCVDSCPSPDPSSNGSPNSCFVSSAAKVAAFNRVWRSPRNDLRSFHFSPKLSTSPNSCYAAPARPSISPSNRCSAKLWWCEDMSSLSMYMMERVVTALQVHGIYNKHICKVLLRYLEASLPLLGYSSLAIGINKANTDEHTLKEYARRVQIEVFETVVKLLHRLEWASVPVKSLFELRRVSIAFNTSDRCTHQIEEMIGSQLHRATLDNILIPRFNGQDRRSCLYDVDLVLHLVKIFLRGEMAAKQQTAPGHDCSLDPVVELELEYGHSSDDVGLQPLRLVGALIDKYLTEIAADVYLKASKFRDLAEVLPSNAREMHDLLYRALDIYCQAHTKISTEDAIKLCRAIDCEKLSFEACKHVMENPRIPTWFTFRVLTFQQDKLRTALGTNLPCSRRPSSEERNPCQPFVTDYSSVIRQNEELRSDLQSMQEKVKELERLCKGLRSQLSQEVWLSC